MPEKKDRSLNVLFGETEVEIITKTAVDLGISMGAAVRLLVRRGANGPAQSPFTPKEKNQ